MVLLQEESSKRIDQVPASIESEAERLHRDIFRPDMEKFKLFTSMLRTNMLYKRAKITHKK